MATTVETFQKIEKKAAESAPFTRKIVNMEIGDVIRQGDVYIERVEKIAPGKETGRQLAAGNTQGSRHVASGDSVTVYEATGDNILLGPSIHATRGWTLTHPEHGHFEMPAGNFCVRFQRDYASERAEEIRRVQD